MTDYTRLDAALTEAVVRATGIPNAKPREGQLKLARAIWDAANTNGGSTIGQAPTGLGKALDVDTPIPTPSGWTTMGELFPGDQVFDENGRVCDVVAVSPVALDRECFEVTFSTGETIVADAEHLWPSATRDLRFKAAERRRQSTARATKLAKIAALERFRLTIEANPMHSQSESAAALTGIADASVVHRARQACGGGRLRQGEKYDLRPVVDLIIESAKSRLPKDVAGYEVLTTEQMAQSLTVGSALNHAVQVAGPLDLPEADLPIDPYILGYWLGDGNSNGGIITVGEQDTEQVVELLTEKWHGSLGVKQAEQASRVSLLRPSPEKCPYGHSTWRQMTNRANNRICTTCEKSENKGVRSNVGLTTLLRELGVLKDKHIPTSYLRSSRAQRLALLQGLMDSDGTYSPGHAEFCVTNERLARQAHELVSSLGIRSTLRSGVAALTIDGVRKECGTRWRVGFTPTLPVFQLTRKADRMGSYTSQSPAKVSHRYVTSIKPVATRPVRCIAVSSESHLFLAGEAMIPTHNSLSYIVPAALDAATNNRRSVISTESLALQSQILDKDAPVVAAAIAHLTGVHVNVQVLKGWSNWACLRATLATAHALLGEREAALSDEPSDAYLSGMQDRIEKFLTDTSSIEIDGVTYPVAEVASLTYWSIQQHIGPGAVNTPGDRASYDSPTGDKAWPAVSVTSADCIGVKKCPFATECKARMAKERAAEAHIIVTNHAMLATQAAKGINVVIGSKSLGDIDNIFVDEAHGLPGIVRDHGAAEVSGRRIRSAVRAVRSILDTDAPVVKRLIDLGDRLANDVDAEIGGLVARIPRGSDVLRLTEGQDPLARNGSAVEAWVKSARNMINDATKGRDDDVKVRRVRSRLDSLFADVDSVVDHRTGVARWVEKTSYQGNDTGNAVKSQPIDVGGLLRSNLWNAPLTIDKREALEDAGEVIEDDQDTYPLSVACVSATLPGGFGMQAGLGTTPTVKYVSPFQVAFENSVLFIPRATSERDIALLSNAYGKFDTSRHLPWAIEKAQELFTAHRGAGLMLSATSSGGQAFAAALREASNGRWTVYSQWDGASVRSTIAAWKEDIDSVMVGTRSLMTGVDAPGPTNSLVVIDRVPRAAGNPVDDARVEDIMERLGMSNKWDADRLVYAADAALLMEQALGRLIRSVSDSGMCAVLDPRLLKLKPFTYNAGAREVYMRALDHPKTKISSMDKALEILRASAAKR